jgi:hypothetical protein
MKIGHLFFFILLFSSCRSTFYLGADDHFSDSLVPPAPDYSLEKNWAALPWQRNFSDSTPKGLVNKKDSALADVFFVYPTTFTTSPKNKFHWNADVNDSLMNRRTDQTSILYQASVFNGSCRIFAPRYRQANLYAFYTKDKSDKYRSLALAYSDVKSAFEYYLKNYNHGHPIIIASHSQGTIHAYRLLRDFFDGKELSKQLVAAYLPGMPVPTDSFHFLKPCAHPGETGCFCTWNTFAFNYYPSFYNDGLNHAICINPLNWTSDTTLVPRDSNRGAVLSNFSKIFPHCSDAQVHDGLLWVHHPHFPFSFLFHWKIYHIIDYNLFYMNVRDNVDLRVKKYLGEKD